VKRIFILGIGSLTGSKLAILTKTNYQVSGSYNLRDPNIQNIVSTKLDITDIKKVESLLSKTNPDFVVNTCAINNVDYCEKNRDVAKNINADFVASLSKTCKSIGTKLIHLSSDSVFDGTKKTPYVETDTPNPINYYGQTKLIGEKPVLENPENTVIRVSVLYGWLIKSISNIPSSSMKPSNFGKWLVEKLKANEKVQVITDEYSSPIIADDFARAILHSIENSLSGLYHAAPQVEITRYDFCKKLAQSLGLNQDLITPVTSKQLGRDVMTGFNKCLDSSKMAKTGFQFMTLDDSLALFRKQVEEK
jgi:dTDP-4-dehydrorhamnose reductase